jgi:hypothetical protein
VGEKADTLFEICLIYFAPRSNEWMAAATFTLFDKLHNKLSLIRQKNN